MATATPSRSLIFLSSDTRRREKLIEAAKRVPFETHEAEWSLSIAEITALTSSDRPGPALLRQSRRSLLGQSLSESLPFSKTEYRYNLVHGDANLQVDQLDAPIAVAIVVPPWPNEPDWKFWDDCSEMLSNIRAKNILFCAVAIDEALTFLKQTPPPVDALHAWERLVADPLIVEDKSLLEATRRTWQQEFVRLDAAWKGRLNNLIKTSIGRRVFSEAIPIDLLLAGSRNVPAFNMGHLVDRMTDPLLHRQYFKSRGWT